jgi:hypothetical protein
MIPQMKFSFLKRAFEEIDDAMELAEQVESLSISPRKRFMTEKALLARLEEMKIDDNSIEEKSVLRTIPEVDEEDTEAPSLPFDPLGLLPSKKEPPNTWYKLTQKFKYECLTLG